ncbi:54S ribosomal protein, mitochondrial [Tulasnella sp. JGI-2019a]|nr:54S ribosomal protein, mitochondrial [Tulasnella sp. JGI-2019a]
MATLLQRARAIVQPYGLASRSFSGSLPAIARASNLNRTPSSSSETLNPPFYLPLSSLLPRKPGEPRASSKVVSLDPSVFSHPIRNDILHAAVVHYRDGLRQGSASTKTRAEVSGSGRKLRPQKGSGRARLGDRGSPMLRGGGRAFGPKPRDFSTKLPRKVIEMATRVGLSAKVKEQSLCVVETLQWPGSKTKDLATRLADLSWNDKILFVCGQHVPKTLRRSASNLQGLETMGAEDLTVYDIVSNKRIVLDLAAVEWLEKKFGKSNVPLNVMPLVPLQILEDPAPSATQ